ncbi:MAG: DUF3794 domain-containing protein [Clostridia bacterium]|nr:DUF3794 domain-containing protein [Clostridia bacterium]
MATESFERFSQKVLGEIYSGRERCRVETEATLPDYKEAALSILRADARCSVTRQTLSLQGQSLVCEVEGSVHLHVLYLTERQGEKGVPSSFSVTEPMNHTVRIPLKGQVDPGEIDAFLDLKAQSVYPKLLGPRRIHLRCEMDLDLTLKKNTELFLYSDPPLSSVHLKKRPVRMASLVSVCREEIDFSETISLPKAYRSIGELCEMNVDLFSKSCTPQEGGVRIAGSCDLCCTYVSEEEEELVSFYQPVEFEKSIGIPECTPDLIPSIHLAPRLLKAVTDVNEEGENKNVFFELVVTAEIRLYRNDFCEVPEDAFCEDAELILEEEETGCEELLRSQEFTQSEKGSISSSDVPERIEALRWNTEFKNSYLESDGIVLEGRVDLCFLSLRSDGELIPTERALDFKTKIPADLSEIPEDARDLRIEVCGGVRALDLVPRDGGLEARFEVCGTVLVFCRHRFVNLSSMKIGEALPEKGRGICFFYPQKNDTLWTLCKEAGVSPEAVCLENGLEAADPLPRVLHVTR